MFLSCEVVVPNYAKQRCVWVVEFRELFPFTNSIDAALLQSPFP